VRRRRRGQTARDLLATKATIPRTRRQRQIESARAGREGMEDQERINTAALRIMSKRSSPHMGDRRRYARRERLKSRTRQIHDETKETHARRNERKARKRTNTRRNARRERLSPRGLLGVRGASVVAELATGPSPSELTMRRRVQRLLDCLCPQPGPRPLHHRHPSAASIRTGHVSRLATAVGWPVSC